MVWMCAQEVAFAVAFAKPIVVLLLEQPAMELLTRPGALPLSTSDAKPSNFADVEAFVALHDVIVQTQKHMS